MNDQMLRGRIARLERTVQKQRIIGLVVAASVLAAALMGAARVPEVIEARAFKVLDASGQARIELSALSDGPATLILTGPDGKIHVRLDASEGNPGLTFYDGQENTRINLKASGLTLLDSNGRARINLAMLSNGSPYLALYDGNTMRAVLGKNEAVKDRSESSLALFDKEGKNIWKAP